MFTTDTEKGLRQIKPPDALKKITAHFYSQPTHVPYIIPPPQKKSLKCLHVVFSFTPLYPVHPLDECSHHMDQ